MAKGNSSSVYATAQPNRINLADTIVQQDRLSMHQAEVKRREAAIEEQRQEKILARNEKLRERVMKVPELYDSGSGSMNELLARVGRQAINRKGEIYNKLRTGGISESERIKLEIENTNLDNLGSNLKHATHVFTKMIGDYDKGTKDGSMHRNLDFESKVLNGFDNWIGTIDENGFPVVAFKDTDGDGELDIMPWDNIKDGVGVWEFQPKLNYDKMITEMAKGLGTEKTKDRDGYDIITTKGIPLDLAQTSASSLMYGPDGDITDFTKSRLTDLGYDYKNVEDGVLKAIEQDVTERIYRSKDRENLRERDTTSEQGALNRAQRERHYNNPKGGDRDRNSIGEAVDPTEGTWKSFYNSIPEGVKSVPITNSKTKFNSLKSKGKTYSNVTIDNYTYDKNGEILISGSFPKKETVVGEFGMSEGTSNENERIRMRGNKEIESRLAKMEGVSIEELREKAGFTEQNMKQEKETISW